MPTTIIGLIIILFAILPGIPAQSIIHVYLGTDWRQSETHKLINIILLSTIGLMLYILVAKILYLPMPIYVLPSTFDKSTFSISTLFPISFSFFGHLVSSSIISIIYVLLNNKLRHTLLKNTKRSAWDDFIHDEIQDHWVIISLVNNQAYAGYIKRADTSVCQSERDVILLEPAKYNETQKKYISTSFQHMFIPANNIYTIASLYDEEKDERISTINEPLFEEEKNV